MLSGGTQRSGTQRSGTQRSGTQRAVLVLEISSNQFKRSNKTVDSDQSLTSSHKTLPSAFEHPDTSGPRSARARAQ